LSLARTVLIAPVGYYENRLWASIFRSGAEKVYLVKSEGPLKKITDYLADSLRSKLGPCAQVIDLETADFSNLSSVYKTFVKIVARELSTTENTKVIIDITSTTKEAAIAATLISQLFDVTISYVPRKEKLKWIASYRSPEAFLEEKKVDREDQGAGYLQYRIKASPLGDDEITALKTVHMKDFDSMNDLINYIGEVKKSPTDSAFQKYWSRVIHRLRDRGLLETVGETKAKQVRLTEIGSGLIEGIVKIKESEQT